MANQSRDRALNQWAVWPPALLCLVGLSLGSWLLRMLAAPVWLNWSYLVPTIVVAWWIAPRLAFRIACDETTLHWRWGILHHDIERQIALADILTIDVITLPDMPRRHIRTVDGLELHGGNFTPALNRGVALALKDGRRICFGLPEPDRFANALRTRLIAST